MTMPPTPSWYDGREAIARFFAEHAFLPDSPVQRRLVAAAANRQPGLGIYVRRPGDDKHKPFGLALLRIERAAIAEITFFRLPELFAAHGLAPEI